MTWKYTMQYMKDYDLVLTIRLSWEKILDNLFQKAKK